MKALGIVLIVLFFLPMPAVAQANVAGGWAVTLTAPLGDIDFRMFIVQKESRLTGYMLNETGQFDMQGTVNGNQIKFEWSFPDGGRLVHITFTGRLEKDVISGSAKVGDLGEGSLSAERRN
jgi:hypothetical protein